MLYLAYKMDSVYLMNAPRNSETSKIKDDIPAIKLRRTPIQAV